MRSICMRIAGVRNHAEFASRSWSRGLTLVEMLVTLALVAVCAAIVLPLNAMIETRAKEAELRQALRVIRRALDDYKAAADSGLISKSTGSSGYPSNLEVLVNGMPRSAAAGAAAPVVFLRRLPRDPFFPSADTPAPQTWRVRSYGAPLGEAGDGKDVFDVSSASQKKALDGSRYSDW
jgi:general secretion pathway protein G